MFAKAGIVRSKRAVEKWKESGDHGDRCQVCHRTWARSGWRGLSVHHIIHGSNGRSDEPCNMLLVCGRCHDMIHDGQYRDEVTKELLSAITLAMVLWIKSQTTEWDGERLTALYHRRLPECEPLAEYYLNERLRQGA